jgi:hypothetical protein
MGKQNLPSTHTALVLDQKIIEGVDKYFAKVKTLTLAGTVYTPRSLKAVLEAEIEATKSLDAAKAQMRQHVADANVARVKARDARRDLRAYILGNFGAKALAMLQDFGMTVPKPAGRKTVASKAEAASKATATRKARKAAEATAPSTPAVQPAPAAAHTP